LAEFLTWVENSALGEAMRGLGVWSYGVFNLVHILGIATLFGSILIVDLRLLGAWRRIPLRSIATPALPLAVLGFGLAAASGICMLTTNAIDYIGNPFLLIKFPAIALGVANAIVVAKLPAWRTAWADERAGGRESRTLALGGGASIVFWLTAVASGRMIGYW
jgi:hypothetical protein